MRHDWGYEITPPWIDFSRPFVNPPIPTEKEGSQHSLTPSNEDL